MVARKHHFYVVSTKSGSTSADDMLRLRIGYGTAGSSQRLDAVRTPAIGVGGQPGIGRPQPEPAPEVSTEIEGGLTSP